MKKFVVILKDPIADRVPVDVNERHVKHLERIAKEERLFLCGPLIGQGKALQILLADSLEEAEDVLRRDPFVSEGFYQNYEIYSLLEANLENHFLFKK